jgi:putative mycofactocin binding protein MftB
VRGVLIAATASPGLLDRPLELDPRVALRPEPFGALAYHYGNRKLVFLRSPEVVEVVAVLADHATAGAALTACGIDPRRWPSFETALAQLERSEILRGR